MSRASRRAERARAQAERRRLKAERAVRAASARRQITTQRLWRRHRRNLIACLFFALVFVTFVVGMASELAEGYVWPAGELTADLVTLAVSSGLVWMTGRRARLAERRAVADIVPEDWLPPAPDEPVPGGIDLAEQTARLRGLVSRAVFIGLVWTVLTGLGAFGSTVGETAAGRLLDTGVEVAGVVVDADDVTRTDYPTFRVRYQVPGGERITEIRWDTYIRYAPGVRLTVVYDPADPGHARTLEEPNDSETFAVLGILLAVTGGIGMLVSLLAALSWRRRYRSVGDTGWRSAEATVSASLDGSLPLILVRYADGTRVRLKSALSLNDAWRVAGPSRRVWVGGTDERMVVLYPHGRWRRKPYAVPARGRSARFPAAGS